MLTQSSIPNQYIMNSLARLIPVKLVKAAVNLLAVILLWCVTVFTMADASETQAADIAGSSEALSRNKPAVELISYLEPISALQGNFTQVIIDSQGREIQKTRGEFKVKRPGHFYWKTLVPYDQLIVTNNDKLWQYDGDLAQATVQPFDRRAGNAPALLLSGETATLEQEFIVTRASNQAANGRDLFTLKSLTANRLFNTLTLGFSDNMISSMEIMDSLGQRTVLSFSALEINPALADDSFIFIPPPGVDLIVDE